MHLMKHLKSIGLELLVQIETDSLYKAYLYFFFPIGVRKAFIPEHLPPVQNSMISLHSDTM